MYKLINKHTKEVYSKGWESKKDLEEFRKEYVNSDNYVIVEDKQFFKPAKKENHE